MDSDKSRLFEPEDVVSQEELEADAEGALKGAARPQLDSAAMWISRDDGLLLRGVKPHSAEKSHMVSRSIDTVTRAMAKQWFVREHGLAYVELYSGPGRLLNELTGVEQPGSPVQALEVPFTRYVFADFDPECVNALEARVGNRSEVTTLVGDAKSPPHLEDVVAHLNPKALTIVYLDPARPQDLTWETIAWLARELPFADLLINLPVNSLYRATRGHALGGGSGPGAAGRFINHESPRDLISESVPASIAAIREHFEAQLDSIGLEHRAYRTVEFPPGSPYYDVVLASRHPRAVELWDKTNPPPEDPQLPLELG